MSEYFAEPKYSGGRMKVELDLSNYTTKADLKNAAGVDSSKFTKTAKIKNIEDKMPDITNLDTNTTLNAKVNEVKNKIPTLTTLATISALNAKINGVKNRILNITNLTTTTDLTTVENKIPNVSNLVKKTDYHSKISEIENRITTDHDRDKYIATHYHTYCKQWKDLTVF